jgi:hypothetical protein
LQAFLEDEEAVTKKLTATYEQALADINGKIAELMARDDADMQHVIYQVEYQKAMKKQIGSILDALYANEFETVAEYITKCYDQGFISSLYSLQQQGIPLCFPINQESVVRAVTLDSKISEGLYSRLGEDVSALKKSIAAEISRGVANGSTSVMISRQIRAHMMGAYGKGTGGALYRALLIARTEGGRIQNQAAMDACTKAKTKGANVVKQWDSTLDAKTRDSHARVDGETRELDERFSNGLKYPHDPGGGAAEVCNCRCALLQRARWALESDVSKMNNFTKQIEQFDSPKGYAEFKKAFFSPENKRYMNYVETLEERYKTYNFPKLLSIMTEREYNHYAKLLAENPIYNKSGGH